MLGEKIINPDHIESEIDASGGLGILPVKTRLTSQKVVKLSKMKVISREGFWNQINGEIFSGYEIHSGRSETETPLFSVTRSGYEPWMETDGCCINGGTSYGTYLHGIFNNDRFRNAWLKSVGIQPSGFHGMEFKRKNLDRWADHLESIIDINL